MSTTINLPEFITFTGVDDFTDPAAMAALSRRYEGRIEWGILFSPERQGTAEHPRYPQLAFVDELFTELQDAALSAHLCGEDARNVLDDGASRHDALLQAYFRRAQVNTSSPNIEVIERWARRNAVVPIVQCQGEFPADQRVQYLFDASGGRGIAPSQWPAGTDVLCGYAGGINPANAAQAVAAIGARAHRYWIDMETGVRDERDRLDLNKCLAVCEAIYGAAHS